MTTPWQHNTKSLKISDQCFVLMPFHTEWSNRIWIDHITPIVKKHYGIHCLRADDLYGSNIMDDIAKGIVESRIIIADITDRNPNVLYELGAAHALDKKVILLAQNESDIPFDLKSQHCIIYNDNPDGYGILESRLPKFIDEILFSGLYDNYKQPIARDEFVVLFLSTGGTCRCAIANAVTRDKLMKGKYPKDIHPVSAGLKCKTSLIASEDARKVVSEHHLSVSLDNHHTLMADVALLRRADVILPMNIALKEALPSQYSDKTILFTEMFGGTGNIEDPYGNGYSAYLETFELIDYLIKENIDKLCLWGERRIREK